MTPLDTFRQTAREMLTGKGGYIDPSVTPKQTELMLAALEAAARKLVEHIIGEDEIWETPGEQPGEAVGARTAFVQAMQRKGPIDIRNDLRAAQRRQLSQGGEDGN